MKFYKRIKRLISSVYQIDHIAQFEPRLKYTLQHDALIEKAINCNEMGISADKYCSSEIIVSLTTYGKRLFQVAATIESIMQGSMKPNRIVLWMGENMKDVTLPRTLQNQQKRGLEIYYCKDIGSYTKLIPTLRKYPEASIITIDDDALYSYDLVEKLVNEHCLYPNYIIANRIHRVRLDSTGRPIKYMNWEWNNSPSDISPLNFLTGVGGVLYPPKSLHPEVQNESVFLDICKYADDIWFYAMALKAGTGIKKGFTHNDRGEDFLINDDVQDIGLRTINTGVNGKNDEQLIAVFEKYDLWKCLRS